MVILYIIILVLVIILQYYIAKQFESVAADKGYAESKYFHLCFWLGLVGYLLVIALPDRNNGSQPCSNNSNTPNSNCSEAISSPKKEPFVWHPVDEANALIVGESNIKCTNCHRIQFKGNTVCNQCGAKFVKVEQQN